MLKQNNVFTDFAVFILTHGRPKRQLTYNSLRQQGYTGPIYLLIDNEDKTKEEYKQIFKNEVIEFDKKEMAKTFDQADQSEDRKTIVYARNASFEVAKKLGIVYFLQLDDDYTNFFFMFDEKNNFKHTAIHNLDTVINIYLEYYKSIPALTIAFAQNGDFIGGSENEFARNLIPKRKAMNSFFCSTQRPFKFVGRINEDVNTYCSLSARGNIFLTPPQIAINQLQTQSNKGGMTETYLTDGTYLKSFYTILFHPSGVKISTMGEKHKRTHHKVSWNNTAPKIIRDNTVNV